MLTSDRDLLSIDPSLLRSVVWLGQRLSSGTCSVSSTTLTASAQDVDFAAAQVAGGHIVTIDEVSYEVVARVSATVLTISRVRAQVTDTPRPVGAMTDRPFAIYTFMPQIAAAEAEILASLSLVPSASAPPSGALTELHVTNPRNLVRPIALLTLRHLADTASITVPAPPTVARASTVYMLLYERAARLIYADIDTDGDGIANERRSPSRFQVVRG